MSGYKDFAVVGAGNIGKFILDAFTAKLAEGTISSVSLLTRSAEGHDEVKAKGVKIVVVDYSSPSSLKSALSNIEVVVSTLGGAGVVSQFDIATAAKDVGVKLFVPSEFGLVTDSITDSAYASKNELKAKLKEIDLPFTAYYTGLFPDMVLAPGFAEVFGFDVKNGKVAIDGEGTVPLSWTTRSDIGRFVAHSLTTFPKEKLHWQRVVIQGDQVSFNNLVEQWSANTGKNITVTHIPISKTKEAYEKNPSDFISLLKVILDSGHGDISKSEYGIANSLWPEWKPASVWDTFKDIYEL